MQNIQLSSNSPVTIGQAINFGAPEVGGYRIYSWTGPDNFTSQEPLNEIVYAQLKNEGWYYLYLSNPTCSARIDSIYVDVKLQQGTPACSVPNNTALFSNQFDDTYSSVLQVFDPSFGCRTLRAAGTGTIAVAFHNYWRTHEPEEGIYTTVNLPVFGQLDYNYNKVYITTTKSSIRFGSHEFQNIYVSHVNNKLQVKFCNLTMSGSNGFNSFTTQASATLAEQ